MIDRSPTPSPSTGPGRKHQRAIELAPWQLELTTAHPRELLRGLIHSDGCRCVNRFETRLPSGRVARYQYPRYFFTNLSSDIRRIFCEHCDAAPSDTTLPVGFPTADRPIFPITRLVQRGSAVCSSAPEVEGGRVAAGLGGVRCGSARHGTWRALRLESGGHAGVV